LSQIERGIKAALVGLLVNIVLVIVKLLAGIAGHSYALVADAIESSTDIFSSLVVWGGLRITTLPADEEYPYGYGKAKSLAAAIASLMLLGAAMGIAERRPSTPSRNPGSDGPYTRQAGHRSDRERGKKRGGGASD